MVIGEPAAFDPVGSCIIRLYVFRFIYHALSGADVPLNLRFTIGIDYPVAHIPTVVYLLGRAKTRVVV